MITSLNNTANKVLTIGLAIGIVYFAAWTNWLDN